MSINKRIKLLRKDTGLNQVEFGSRIGLKQSAASKMEQEGSTVTEQNIQIICSTFNVSRAWLECGEGEMYAPKEAPPLIEQLADEFKLDAEERGMVEAFLQLSDSNRKGVIAYVKAAARKAGYVPEDTESADKTADTEQRIQAEIAAYEQELRAEAKGKTSSASDAGNSYIENEA